MRWTWNGPKWHRRFALLPTTCGRDTIWLEWYWYRPGGEGGEAWFDHWGPRPA